jgi:hypothetical protein
MLSGCRCTVETQRYVLNEKDGTAGKVVQVVEHMPGKCEVLNSNPSKKKRYCKLTDFY